MKHLGRILSVVVVLAFSLSFLLPAGAFAADRSAAETEIRRATESLGPERDWVSFDREPAEYNVGDIVTISFDLSKTEDPIQMASFTLSTAGLRFLGGTQGLVSSTLNRSYPWGTSLSVIMSKSGTVFGSKAEARYRIVGNPGGKASFQMNGTWMNGVQRTDFGWSRTLDISITGEPKISQSPAAGEVEAFLSADAGWFEAARSENGTVLFSFDLDRLHPLVRGASFTLSSPDGELKPVAAAAAPGEEAREAASQHVLLHSNQTMAQYGLSAEKDAPIRLVLSDGAWSDGYDDHAFSWGGTLIVKTDGTTELEPDRKPAEPSENPSASAPPTPSASAAPSASATASSSATAAPSAKPSPSASPSRPVLPTPDDNPGDTLKPTSPWITLNAPDAPTKNDIVELTFDLRKASPHIRAVSFFLETRPTDALVFDSLEGGLLCSADGSQIVLLAEDHHDLGYVTIRYHVQKDLAAETVEFRPTQAVYSDGFRDYDLGWTEPLTLSDISTWVFPEGESAAVQLRSGTGFGVYKTSMAGTLIKSQSNPGKVTAGDLAHAFTGPSGYEIRVTEANGAQRQSAAALATGNQVRLLKDGLVLETAPVCVPGDVTGSGKLGLSQLIRMCHAVAGNDPLRGVYMVAGDMSGNGKIDLSDLVLMARQMRASE